MLLEFGKVIEVEDRDNWGNANGKEILPEVFRTRSMRCNPFV